MLTVPIPTQPFNPVAWAHANYWLPYARPVITDIPGAGVTPSRRIPCWPEPASQATFVSYWPARWAMPQGCGLGGLSGAAEGLGRSIFDEISSVAEREIGSEVERVVQKAALRYLVPPMVLSIGLSLVALAVAVSVAQQVGKTKRSNRRRRRR